MPMREAERGYNVEQILVPPLRRPPRGAAAGTVESVIKSDIRLVVGQAAMKMTTSPSGPRSSGRDLIAITWRGGIAVALGATLIEVDGSATASGYADATADLLRIVAVLALAGAAILLAWHVLTSRRAQVAATALAGRESLAAG